MLELKKYNFLTIEAFGPTDDKISMLNQHLDMYVTAFISNPTEKNARQIKEIYGLLFSKKTFSKLKINKNSHSLPMKDFLISIIYLYDTLETNKFLDASEKRSFLNEIQKRFNKIKIAICVFYDFRDFFFLNFGIFNLSEN